MLAGFVLVTVSMYFEVGLLPAVQVTLLPKVPSSGWTLEPQPMEHVEPAPTAATVRRMTVYGNSCSEFLASC